MNAALARNQLRGRRRDSGDLKAKMGFTQEEGVQDGELSHQHRDLASVEIES